MSAVSGAQVEAFFLARAEHSLFCLLFTPPPDVPRAGAVVHVPAFAEEMNKSRRAVANAARAMAERGWQVLVFDPHGTGDSSDDFGAATWSGWLEDVCAAAGWLREHSATEPVLWGLRAGCLLINDVLEQVNPRGLIFWQPFLAGDIALTQFLRLRTMGAIGNADRPKETAPALLEMLRRGSTLEIAGYSLAPALAMPLRQARLGGPCYQGKRIAWLEVSASEPPECSPVSNARIQELRAAGAEVVAEAVAGTSFWTTQELDEGAPIVSATVDRALQTL